MRDYCISSLSLVLVPLIHSFTTIAAPVDAGSVTWTDCPTALSDIAPSLDWSQILPALRCANISVPLDYSKPDADQIPLMLVKLPANDTETYQGSLVLQLGGPGLISTEALVTAANGVDVFGELRSHFDIVTAEPRGIAWNHAVKCDPRYNQQRFKAFPRTEEDYQEALDFYEAMGRDCLERTGEVMHFMDTQTQARDLEAVRVALGGKPLNYYGLSWGTMRGSAYANLYPNHIRTMVLDGVVDHSLSEVMFSASEAYGYSVTLRRMFEWMRSNNSSALYDRDVASEFQDLLTRADAEAIAAPECLESGACFANVTGDDFRRAVFDPVNHPEQWPSLAELLKEVFDNNNASGLAYPLSDQETGSGNSMFGIICQDYDWPDSWAEYQKLQYMHAAYSPEPQGPLGARTWPIGCARWPTKVNNPPASLRTSNISAPIMIVNALWDPATGYDMALNLHRQLEGSVLVTRYGEGHGSLTWPAAKRVMDRYYIDVEVPKSESPLVDSPLSTLRTDFELQRLGHDEV